MDNSEQLELDKAYARIVDAVGTPFSLLRFLIFFAFFAVSATGFIFTGASVDGSLIVGIVFACLAAATVTFGFRNFGSNSRRYNELVKRLVATEQRAAAAENRVIELESK